MFRERAGKKKKSINHKNLDAIHQDKINAFSTETMNLDQYISERENCIIELTHLQQIPLKTSDDFNKIRVRRDQIKDIDDKIFNIENSVDEMDYYFKTSSLLQKYYDENVALTKSKMTITDFFQKSKQDNSDNKKKMFNTYMNLIDQNVSDVKTRKIHAYSCCDRCDIEMLVDCNNMHVCPTCGEIDVPMLEQDSRYQESYPSNTESQRYSVYQRKNHFKEWINQIQGRESNDVPQEVIDMVLLELHKIRFENLALLEQSHVRKILKKLNLSRYYENTFHIINRINGLPPPTLSRDTEDQLVKLFKQIEEPFEMFKSENRKNILRYSYILYKFCELLELDDFLRCFRLLKNRNKLIQQDEIWKKICEYNQWEFISSI